MNNEAEKVISLLKDRKGFEEWWETIGEENRTEIRQKIQDLIDEAKKDYLIEFS